MQVNGVTLKYTGLWQKLVSGAANGGVRIGVAAGAQYSKGGPSVADVAMWNHEGTGTIPARPFLAVPLDPHTPELRAYVERIKNKVLVRPDLRNALLAALGEWCRNRVIAAINAGFPPPNAPSTIARKGSDTPLVDSGIMRNSIIYVVEVDRP
jgi:hypothetical protein